MAAGEHTGTHGGDQGACSRSPRPKNARILPPALLSSRLSVCLGPTLVQSVASSARCPVGLSSPSFWASRCPLAADLCGPPPAGPAPPGGACQSIAPWPANAGSTAEVGSHDCVMSAVSRRLLHRSDPDRRQRQRRTQRGNQRPPAGPPRPVTSRHKLSHKARAAPRLQDLPHAPPREHRISAHTRMPTL